MVQKTLSRLANFGEENEFLGSLQGQGNLLKQSRENKINVLSFGYENKNIVNFLLVVFYSIKFSRKIKADFIYICGLKLVR